MLVDFLFMLTLLLTGKCQREEGVQKAAVSLANSNISCSLNLNLGENCLERDEVKMEMKAVVEELKVQINNSINQMRHELNAQMQRISALETDRLIDLITLHSIGSFGNPALSCQDLPVGSPSGHYWTLGNDSIRLTQRRVYCDMTRRCCNQTGWMRVAYLDMTDPTQQCPGGFRQINSPKRACGSYRLTGPGCVSTTFPVNGTRYSKVCGRIKAYQDKTSEAFDPYLTQQLLSIDSYYVDGVSLTHGRPPRSHIWTFAAALDEVHSNSWVCPCTRPDLGFTGSVPPFIGQDYFCETGSRSKYQYIFHDQDPLWDGEGCGPQSTCCSFNNPPWFCKELSQSTTNDIELRICSDQGSNNEDTPIEMFELYVQ